MLLQAYGVFLRAFRLLNQKMKTISSTIPMTRRNEKVPRMPPINVDESADSIESAMVTGSEAINN